MKKYKNGYRSGVPPFINRLPKCFETVSPSDHDTGAGRYHGIHRDPRAREFL
jgi:hypothetical protein